MIRIVSGLVGALLIVIVLFKPLAAQDNSDPAFTVEQYALANYPVSMAFAPDGRLFYTEKATGDVRVINADGKTQLDSVIHLDTDSLVERGLLGIALDPDYVNNGMIWVVHTNPGNARDYPANQVVRFHEANGVGDSPEVMLSVPITTGELKHNGGNLRFDTDGTLFLSLGDFGDSANAQDLTTLPGKIHHFQVTDEGLVPAEGNPFPDSSVYAYGLRNTFDFTIDPVSETVFGSENGFHCDDEINHILPGKNYGWGPDYGENCYGTEALDLPDYMIPLVSFNPTVAPTGIIFYDGTAFPEWKNDLFFCEWNTGLIQHAVLNDDRTAFDSVTALDTQNFFCRIDIIVGTDGDLYFTDPGGIYRIKPA